MAARDRRDIETIVRELDARQQIHDVVVRYCRGTDHRHDALLQTVYHPDATDDHGFFNGSAQEFIGLLVNGNTDLINKTHLICNEYVEFDEADPDVAYGETTAVGCMTRSGSDGYELSVSCCRYLDRFECRGGEWRIAERKLVLDWEFKVPTTGNQGTKLTTDMLRGLPSPSDPSFGWGFRPVGDAQVPISSERTPGLSPPAA